MTNERSNKMKKTVVIATLYRFGYDLTVAEETKEKAEKAMMKEYREAFIKWNDGLKPTKEEKDNAREDICFDELTYGEVEWL